ncbi:hypothetical protein VTH82DRAFT_4893 [Thermothelomyces myriococcoides]
MKPSFDIIEKEREPRPAERLQRQRTPGVRVILVLLVVVYALYCYVLSKPLLAHPLPRHTGPYAVGTVDIETPISPPRTIHEARFRETGEKAFELKSVLFSLYYPASHAAAMSGHPRRHPWVPEPLALRAQGYAKAARISNRFTDKLFTFVLNALVGDITIPATVDAPLSDPITRTSQDGALERTSEHEGNRAPTSLGNEESLSPDNGFPVIIFSHGTVSSRTDYSHFAGELAARGHVVVMMEHRDGSCPGTVIRQHPEVPNRTQLLFDVAAVEMPDRQLSLTVEEFHEAQLAFRQAEMEEAVRVLRRIVDAGEGVAVHAQNPFGEGADLARWGSKNAGEEESRQGRRRINTHSMVVAGHSYGATGALRALRGGPTHALPFHGAIALDPGKQSGPLNHDLRVPLLVVHSDSWSRPGTNRSSSSSTKGSGASGMLYGAEGRAHFDVVRDIAAGANARGHPAWFMTSIGTSHPSVTDAPLLEPTLLRFTTGATIDVYQGLRQYVHVADDFLAFLAGGRPRGLLAEKAEFPQYDPGAAGAAAALLGVGKPGQGGRKSRGFVEDLRRGEWTDWKRYWQIHVSPAGNADEKE